MLDGNPARLRLAYSVLFSLPGAPMLFYGEEIGMGENPALDGRLAVRAPMQWTPYDSGGFSGAPPEALVRPMLADGAYGYRTTSVAAQRGDPGSLLNWMASLIRVRRECGEIGGGGLAARRHRQRGYPRDPVRRAGQHHLVVNNLSPDRQSVSLGLEDDELERATDLLADRVYPPMREKRGPMRLNAYGFRWMRLGGEY